MKKLFVLSLAAAAMVFALGSSAQVTPPKEKVFDSAEIPSYDLWDGQVRLKAFQGSNTMLVLNEIDKGAGAPLHNHPNEQITYIVSGRLRFMVDGREHTLGPGELVVIPAYMEHSAEALEDTFTVESFGPTRADWQEWAH